MHKAIKVDFACDSRHGCYHIRWVRVGGIYENINAKA